MFICLLSLIFIRPFISSLAFPYLNSIYSALLLGLLAALILAKNISWDKLKSSGYKLPLTIFCLALAVSTIYSANKLKSLAELYKYASGLLLFLVAAALSSEKNERLARVIVSAGLIISGLAAYQYFFGFSHILNYMAREKINDPFTLELVAQKRVFFPFVTTNALAGYIAMVVPLTFTLKYRAAWAIPLFCALLLTRSLGGILSLLLGLLLYFFLQGKIGKKKIILLCCLAMIAVLVFLSRTFVAQQHLQPAFSGLMRISYWKDTLAMIQNHPLAGVGLGNFNLVHSRYAHNSFLQLWAETGILGIISFLWLLFLVFYSAVKNTGVSKDKTLLLSLISANAIFLIHNLVDFTLFLPEVSLVWWVILGLAAARVLPSEPRINH
jgi:putative inorganic carbon (hco3(-)) transporter